MIRSVQSLGRSPLPLLMMAMLLPAALLIAPRPIAAGNWGQEQVSRDFQQTLTLGGRQSLRIEHKFGGINLHAGPGREVKISATIRAQASSHDEAQSFVQQIKIEVQQTSEGVSIRTIYPEKEKSWFHSGRNSSWSVNYDITLPSDAPIYVRNSFGGVEINGVHGSADVENGYGSLVVRDAGSGRWVNSFGSIELAGAAGNASITTTNSSVQVSDVKGNLDVRNRFGSITTRNIQGSATLNGGNGNVSVTDAASANVTTSFGGVEARNIRGDLFIHDNNGNIDFSNIAGAADITDSFCNVTFSDVKGRLNCTTSNGRVKGSSVQGGSVTIRDSFGNVELDTISGALEAETSNGKITVRDARGTVSLNSSFGALEAFNIPKGIRAVTGNGSITLNDIGGDTYAKTSFGSVTTERINGNLTVENTNGSVTARNVKGDAGVKTSFAGVTLDSIGGRITVDDQNGAIAVAANRSSGACRDVSLKTSFSSIHVRIPDGFGYNLTARTSFGRISSELPVTATGSMGNDSLSGTIGSGGCQLQLTNSNGNIEIAKAQ